MHPAGVLTPGFLSGDATVSAVVLLFQAVVQILTNHVKTLQEITACSKNFIPSTVGKKSSETAF